MNINPAEKSKITLSPAEMRLVSDAGFILTKNSIMEKVNQLFGRVAIGYGSELEVLNSRLPEVFRDGAKISRGEKYADLPWAMLDYPRCFSRDQGHFALRTFFWWGNYFSLRLQLSGHYRLRFERQLTAAFQQDPGWHMGTTADPWDQRLPNPEWNAPGEGSPSVSQETKPWFVVACTFPLEKWEEAEEWLILQCRQLSQALEMA